MSERSRHSKERPAESCAMSISSLQEFRCSGVPLDSPIIKERERLKKARRAEQQDNEQQESPPEGPKG